MGNTFVEPQPTPLALLLLGHRSDPASERGVEMLAPSRLYFSVSDWHASDFNGDAHFLWPLAEGQR